MNIKDLHSKLESLVNIQSQPKGPFSFDSFMNIISEISEADLSKFLSGHFVSQLKDFFDDLTDISLAKGLDSYYFSIRSLRFDLIDSSSSTLLIGLGLVSVLAWNSGDSYQVSCPKKVEFSKRRACKTISIRKKGAPGSTITIRLRFACP